MTGSEKKCKMPGLADAGVFPALVLWTFLINHRVHISWPFCDDLYPWKDFSEMGFADYVFPSHAQHLRTVSWLAEWLVFTGIGKNLQLAVVINIVLLSAVSFFLYRFLRQLSGSRPVSFLLSLMFVTSRFSYYGISLITGTGEIIALFLIFSMCRLLFDFSKGEASCRYEFAALCWLLAALTHERYMVLFPMLLYAALLRQLRFSANGPLRFSGGEQAVFQKENSGAVLRRALEAMALFALLQLARKKIIGTLLPEGTAGTALAETFSEREFIKNVFSQVAYLFGINAGPTHLNGMPWNETPLPVKGLTILFILLILLAVCLFIRQLFRSGENRTASMEAEKQESREISNVCADLLLFTGFIIGCVTASSVTVRVYMRWIYGSFGFCCMILAFMHGYFKKKTMNSDAALKVRMLKRTRQSGLLTALACILMIGCDSYYRENSRDFYIYQDQYRRDSLLEKTWEAFGEEIYDMKIYILGNTYELTDFEKENFFRPSGMLPAALPIEHIGSLEEIPEGETGYIALMECPGTDTYEYAAYVPAK